MKFVKDHLPLQQWSKRNSCCHTLSSKRRHGRATFAQGHIAKDNSRDPADLQICSAELNFQFGLFLDFIDKKPAHLADPHQMIEGQRSNDEEKHQRCAEESEKLESFSHAENDVSNDSRSTDLGRQKDVVMLEELF